jgi:hypothetical protein
VSALISTFRKWFKIESKFAIFLYLKRGRILLSNGSKLSDLIVEGSLLT